MALSFFSKHNEKEIKKQIPDRIKKLKTDELVSWMDSTIMLLGQTFDDWRHHDGAIEEVALITETLEQMSSELAERFSK